MKRIICLLLLSVTLCESSIALADHSFVIQGNDRLAVVAADGRIEWEMPWGGIHDVHVLPSGNIMVQEGTSKIVEIDRQTRKVIWSYDAANSNGNQGKRVEVHAFQPLPYDRVMIAESGPARIIEIDRAGKLLREVKLKTEHPNAHSDTRLARKLPNGHYLVCHEADGAVREYAQSGEVVWEFAVPLFSQERKAGHGPEAFGNQVFSAIRLPNGNTLVGTGNGHSVLEVTPEGKIAWEIHQHDFPGITLAWVTTLEVLPDGNYVIGNCHAGSGNPLLIKLDPKTKKIVWKYDGYDKFGNSASNSQLLDVLGKTLR